MRLTADGLRAARRVLLTGVVLASGFAPALAQTPCGDEVQVKPGDTLFGIAERCGTSVEALRRANPGVDPRDMHVGLLLRLPRAAEEPPPTQATVAISPESGPVGTRIEINASGFPSEARVKIGGGPPRSEYTVMERMRAGGNGELEAVVRLPEHARDNGRWVFVVSTEDNRVKAVSEPFDITRQNGRSGLTVTGSLTGEGVECPALRADDGALYTLAGDIGSFGPGARITVEGKVAEVSICMQGTTIEVGEVRAAN